MVFSSHLFLFYFLPLALGVYYAVPRRARHLALTLLSYVFHGWAEPRFALVLLGTTAVDYAAALAIARVTPWSKGAIEPLPPGGERSAMQRAAIGASVISNLGVLGFFKYFNFAAESYGQLLAMLGAGGAAGHATLRMALPLGISFYIFQSLSYTIDVYRGHARATRNLIDLACFVSMFPQLVAGPIVRYAEVADQLASRTHTPEKFARGVAFFSLGLAKKVLLANPCGAVADALFATPGIGAADAWYGAVAYAFQIYFDFSGYSDMAVGLGLMMGFMFPKNFDAPYAATSITDFWRRWHISLSTWLRDYLYVPLGGNRRGPGRTYLNIAAVMLLGGLWHGAAWTFVAWGAIHAVALMAERALCGRARFQTTSGAGRSEAADISSDPRSADAPNLSAGAGRSAAADSSSIEGRGIERGKTRFHAPSRPRLARPPAGRFRGSETASNPGRAAALLPALPRVANVALTFAIVTVAWVFFRSPDLPTALAYFRSMLALGETAPAAALVRGVVYQPYYVLTLLACAGVTWLSPQAWDFTRSLPPWRLAWAIALLWVAIAVLETQAYNPFIYFIF